MNSAKLDSDSWLRKQVILLLGEKSIRTVHYITFDSQFMHVN